MTDVCASSSPTKSVFTADNLGFVLACICTALYAWTVYVPLIPSDIVISAEWLWPLSIATVKRLAFGRDIMFTYGPLGFAVSGYYPTTFAALVAIWTIFAGILWTAMFFITRRLGAPRVVRVAIVALFFATAAGQHIVMPDVRVLIIPVVLLAYHFSIDDSPSSAVKLLLASALGLAGLIKFTYLLAGALTCGVVAADELLRTRKPFTLISFLGVFLVGWRLSGQMLSGLPAYLASSLDIASGYNQDMALWLASERLDVLRYIVPGLLILGLAWMLAPYRSFVRRLVHVGSLLVVLWMVFKAGYVRHDPTHEVIATSLLPLAAIVLALTTWQTGRRKTYVVGWSVALATSLFCASSSYTAGGGPNVLRRAYHSLFHAADELAEAGRVLSGGPTSASLRYVRLREFIRNVKPIPQVAGPTDVMSVTWTILGPANDLDYVPRPAILDYAAITPRVAAADAAFYRDPHGPANVFFLPQVTDDRLIAEEDGPAMLELLSRFDVLSSRDGILLFRRSDSPRSFSMKLLSHQQAQFMRPVVIPSSDGKVIWTVIDVKQTFLGTLVTSLYKLPDLWISLTFRNGASRPIARFIRGCGRAGFIISPLIQDSAGLADISTPRVPAPSGPIYPAQFRIGTFRGTVPGYGFGETFDVSFYEVVISPSQR